MYLKFYWRDWIIKMSVFISAFLLLFSAVLIFYLFYVLSIKEMESPFIVLHSSVYFGVDLIGEGWHLFLFPITGFIFFLINWFVADRLWKMSHLYTRLLLITTVFIEIFVFLACVSVLRWNI